MILEALVSLLQNLWDCVVLSNASKQCTYLEVETDTWQVHERLHTSLAELLGVTNTGSLEDEWRAEGTTGDDDLLAGPDDLGLQLSWGEGLCGHGLDTDRFVAL